MILIYMMVLCTQVNKMYVIATLSVYPHRCGYALRVAITYITIYSQAQYKLYKTKIYAQKNYTMQITSRHVTTSHMFITNTLTGLLSI